MERVFKAYDRDRLHSAPTEVFAQNIGYKSANNGAALAVLASLRYYGLVERPSDGMLAVAKNVESYKFAPDQELKRSILLSFLRSPQLYDDLLSKYASGLPSDANLRYELIQRGFAPAAAESALVAFKRSVEFAGFFEKDLPSESLTERDAPASSEPVSVTQSYPSLQALVGSGKAEPEKNEDQIPVRLPGGRRAWLIIPSPFYASDKDRLKAQIDLLLTAEEDEEYPD
jgi:hypothetical protein